MVEINNFRKILIASQKIKKKIGGMEVVYKLAPYMEYASKLNDYHIESLERKYNQYKEEVRKLDSRSHSHSRIQGVIDGIEAAMMSIGYEFVEEKEKQ